MIHKVSILFSSFAIKTDPIRTPPRPLPLQGCTEEGTGGDVVQRQVSWFYGVMLKIKKVPPRVVEHSYW